MRSEVTATDNAKIPTILIIKPYFSNLFWDSTGNCCPELADGFSSLSSISSWSKGSHLLRVLLFTAINTATESKWLPQNYSHKKTAANSTFWVTQTFWTSYSKRKLNNVISQHWSIYVTSWEGVSPLLLTGTDWRMGRTSAWRRKHVQHTALSVWLWTRMPSKASTSVLEARKPCIQLLPSPLTVKALDPLSPSNNRSNFCSITSQPTPQTIMLLHSMDLSLQCQILAHIFMW